MHLLAERLVFGDDDWVYWNGVETYQMAPTSPVNSPTFFLSSHLWSIWSDVYHDCYFIVSFDIITFSKTTAVRRSKGTRIERIESFRDLLLPVKGMNTCEFMISVFLLSYIYWGFQRLDSRCTLHRKNWESKKQSSGPLQGIESLWCE